MQRAPRLASKTAMVVVDMTEEDRHRIAWGRGPAEEGIRTLARAIESAGKLGMARAFVTNMRHATVLRELADAGGLDAPAFRKELSSAFSSHGFRRFLDEINADALIIGGWAKHLCVRDTAIDAMLREYQVLTTEDILFHRDLIPPQPMMSDSELRLNSHLITMYPDADSLFASLRRTRA